MDKVQPVKSQIVIGICTRQRNALLRRLLESIWAQPSPPSHNVSIIVVDNNDAPSVADVLGDLPHKFKLTVVHEAQPGMVTARNRALDAATDMQADWFIGVDDDEYVAPDWLAQFIIGLETLDAQIIVAARQILFPETAHRFIERIQHLQEPAGATSKVLSTANFAMHKSVFNPTCGPGLRFDPALNEAGGVDYELMLRARHQHGITAVNWPHAIAVEPFDGLRATLPFSLKRRMFNQARMYQIARLHRITGIRGSRIGNALHIARLTNMYLIKGVAACLMGAGMLLIRRKGANQTIAGGLRKLARAAAVFPYLLGTDVVHYGAEVNADRTT